MSESTPNFGIVYPCGGQTIDCGAFADFTNSIQVGLNTLDALQAQAQAMPSATISLTSTQNVVVATPTDVLFQSETWDNDGMATLAVNADRLTVQTAGTYLVALHLQDNGVFTTITSQSVALSQNGTILFRKKNGSSTNRTFSLQVTGLFDCVAGDILRSRYLWTGTGGPNGISVARMSARCVALA